MVPFVADVLVGIVHHLLERIILKNVLYRVTNLYQLVQINPSHKNIRKSAADIDIGFTANIKVEVSNCKPNDPKVLVCKRETGNFLGAFLSDLLKYVLVRRAAF